MFNTTPLAYKYVMTMLMVSFINHYASKLHMPFDLPLGEKQIQHIVIARPLSLKTANIYGAGYRERNWDLSFSETHFPYSDDFGGFSLTKLEDDGLSSFGISLLNPEESANSLMERASKMKYKITGTNMLYEIAANYLADLDLNAKNLEMTSPLTLNKYSDFHSSRGIVPSPLMYIMWGKPELRNPGSNGIAMEFSAVSGELLELDAGISVCKNFPRIKNIDKLLAIPDADFMKYSSLERSNLVAQFSYSFIGNEVSESNAKSTLDVDKTLKRN
jgi:hypothetical protein